MRRVAMEYSPACAIPYLSRVDAGTVERISSLGPEVVSSGDLVQRFEAAWNRTALETHRTASQHLHAIKDRTFELIRTRAAGGTTSEYEVQQKMVEWFREAGPWSPTARRWSRRRRAAETRTTCPPRRITGRSGPVRSSCSTCGGKLDRPGAVYADITWVGFTGPAVPAEAAAVFGAAPRGSRRRDRACVRTACGADDRSTAGRWTAPPAR